MIVLFADKNQNFSINSNRAFLISVLFGFSGSFTTDNYLSIRNGTLFPSSRGLEFSLSGIMFR